MRALGPSLIAMAALLLTTTSAAGGAPTDAECRQQWGDLAALHGENGNPEGSAATRQLQARWEGYYDEAGRLAEEATGADCNGIEAFAATWGGLERLMYGLHRHDYRFQLRIAKGDLRHFQEFNESFPGRRVMRAFRFLRQQAPLAAGDLAPLFEAAPAVSTAEPEQITVFLRDYRAAAHDSLHVAKARVWLRIIADAELSEE